MEVPHRGMGWRATRRSTASIVPSFLFMVILVTRVTGMSRANSIKQRFLEAGYSAQELWALSYNGKSTKHARRRSNAAPIPEPTRLIWLPLSRTCWLIPALQRWISSATRWES